MILNEIGKSDVVVIDVYMATEIFEHKVILNDVEVVNVKNVYIGKEILNVLAVCNAFLVTTSAYKEI